MTGAKIFWALSVALMAASFVANGGWNGNRFVRIKNEAAADRMLFLAWAMLVGCAAARIGG